MLKISYSYYDYYNTGFSNIDNNGELISYQNHSSYLNYSLSHLSDFIYFKFSPQLNLTNNGKSSTQKDNGTFSYLNDRTERYSKRVDYKYLAQSTFALHYKHIGFGISNQNMWIGPGFHSSLSQSNNAPGFNHFFMGTMKQKKYKNIGIDLKYFLSERQNYETNFFHTNLSTSLTYYNNPTITIGFSRTYLSGGIDNQNKWTLFDASKLVFEPLFGKNKTGLNYTGLEEEEPLYWDKWDQLLVGFINIYFPKIKSHYYLELGTDDSRANLIDLKAHWDHSLGYIIGFKKYGLFGNPHVFLGMEIMSNKNSSNTLNKLFYRGDYDTPNFYNRGLYLHSTYGGRRWAANSGSDSIDRIFMLGFNKDNYSIITSFNFEIRGIISMPFPEKKHESIIILRKINNNIIYSFYLENEKIYNYKFNNNKKPEISNVIGFSITLKIKY